MLRWIDRWRLLSNILDWFSNLLAKKRGLPVLVGVLLIFASLVIQSTSVYVDNQPLELLGVMFEHAGVLIALIGLLLATPLGR